MLKFKNLVAKNGEVVVRGKDIKDLICICNDKTDIFLKVPVLDGTEKLIPCDVIKTIDGIKIEGYSGTWYSIEHLYNSEDGLMFLVESEIYGDEAADIIIDINGNVILEGVYDGFNNYEEWLEEREGEKMNKNTTKYYAKQVPPEHQDCCYLWDDVLMENTDKICITGNRDSAGVTTEEYDIFVKAIYNVDKYLRIDGELANKCCYDSFEEFVDDLFHTSSKPIYNEQELIQWKELFIDFMNKETNIDEDFICRGLSIMTGKEYDNWTIRGCCQSEWNILFAPKGTDYNYYQTIYFNQGTEWLISEKEDFEDCYGYYSVQSYEDDIVKDLAEECGCKINEIKVLAFDGYIQTPKYREI